MAFDGLLHCPALDGEPDIAAMTTSCVHDVLLRGSHPLHDIDTDAVGVTHDEMAIAPRLVA
jgi:hypothetical protein